MVALWRAPLFFLGGGIGQESGVQVLMFSTSLRAVQPALLVVFLFVLTWSWLQQVDWLFCKLRLVEAHGGGLCKIMLSADFFLRVIRLGGLF